MFRILRAFPHEYRFAWDTLLITVTSALTGFLFVMVHHVLGGYMMDEVEYAALVALVGLLNFLALPCSALRIAMARFVAEHAHQNEVAAWVTLVRRALKRITVIGGISLVAWCLASHWIRQGLNAPSNLSVMLVGLISFLGLYHPVVQGALQGAKSFTWLAASGLTAGASRVVLAVIAYSLVSSVSPVLLAFALSGVLSIGVAYWPYRHAIQDARHVAGYDTRPIYKYLWPVMIGQGAIFLLLNGDLIFLNRFLAGETMAAYGKAAMLSRIVLFLPMPIAVTMFPQAVISNHPKWLLGPLFFSLFISFIFALGLSICPQWPMRLLYRIDNPLYLDLTRLYVWAAVPLVPLQILAQYLWARHRTSSVLWLGVPATGYLAGLFAWHETPQQLIAVLASGGFAGLATITVAGLMRAPSNRGSATTS